MNASTRSAKTQVVNQSADVALTGLRDQNIRRGGKLWFRPKPGRRIPWLGFQGFMENANFGIGAAASLWCWLPRARLLEIKQHLDKLCFVRSPSPFLNLCLPVVRRKSSSIEAVGDFRKRHPPSGLQVCKSLGSVEQRWKNTAARLTGRTSRQTPCSCMSCTVWW